MPLSVVTFTTKNPTAIRLALKEVLENSGYITFVDTQTKIIADHSRSLTQDDHAIEIEFSEMSIDPCSQTTVTVKINHFFSKVYMKSVLDKLLKIAQDLTITSAKPEMKFDNLATEFYTPAANPACIERDPSSIMKGQWKCQNCGAENAVTLDLCEKCGATRHSSWEPATTSGVESSFEEIDADEQENDDDDQMKSIY